MEETNVVEEANEVEEVEVEEVEEVKEINQNPLLVRFKKEDKNYEFKHVILCGALVENTKDEISTIISGFNEIDDFVTTYNSIILQAYEFLVTNAGINKAEVINALRESAMSVFDGLEEGAFDQYFNDTEDII